VNRQTGAFLMAFFGVLLLRLGLTDLYLLYVKAGMRPFLVVSGFVLLVLAISQAAGGWLQARRTPADVEAEPAHDADVMLHPFEPLGAESVHDAHAHGHEHGRAWVALVLALPGLAVFLVSPGPLGAFAASRQPQRQPDAAAYLVYPPLAAPVNGAVDMKLADFIDRAFFDRSSEFESATVRLVGFVTPAKDEATADGFRLTRFVLSCCAADGRPIYVSIRGLQPGNIPAPDTWVQVTGKWRSTPAERQNFTPELVAQSVEPTSQPTDPYET
jgi:uncharacterized repeat protein (TIGR03943 family)